MPNELIKLLLIIHSASTLIMVGAIWYVQIVHYPQFRLIPAELFIAYEKCHQRGIIVTVVPWMAIELVSGLLLLIWPGLFGFLPAVVGALLLAGIWVHTFGFQLPRHRILEKGLRPEILEKLIQSNWIRTILWTVRGLVICYVLF